MQVPVVGAGDGEGVEWGGHGALLSHYRPTLRWAAPALCMSIDGSGAMPRPRISCW
jgi:hypothetical protein